MQPDSSGGEKPTVFIIDDEVHLGASLVNLFEAMQRDARSFTDPEEFLTTLKPSARGCILLDIHMPGMGGLELQSRLIGQGNVLPIIFMTGNNNASMSVSAMKSGAFDFLLKPFDSETVLSVTQRAIEFDEIKRVAKTSQDDVVDCERSLTPREREVFGFVIRGLMNKQIAYEMKISEIMVKLHRGRMMRKMKARTIAEIVTKGHALQSEQSSLSNG